MEYAALAALGVIVLILAVGFARYQLLNVALDRALTQIEADHANGTAPVSYAGTGSTVARSDIEQVLGPIRKGANVNRRNAEGLTPLMVACDWGNVELARAILERGGRLNLQDRSGATPLHHAVRSGNGFLVDLLLAHRASPDARDAQGETPLFEASRKGSVRSVRALLQHGANPNARNAAGETPLSVIRMEEVRLHVRQPGLAHLFTGWRDCHMLLRAHSAHK